MGRHMMRKLILAGLMLFLPLLVGCPNSGGPAVVAGKLGPGESFAVAIEQDGRAVPVRDHQVRLKRKAFAVVLAFGRLDGVMVNASFSPRLYEAALERRPLAGVLPLPKRGLAEELFNPDREIFVTDSAYHHWYYFSPKIHRFDSVEKVGEVWVCRRGVQRYRQDGRSGAADLRKIDRRDLYLVFTKTDWSGDHTRRIEKQTEYLHVVFE